MAQLCEPFSQHPAEIVVIIVEDHDPLPCRAKLAEWMIACQEAVGRQDEGVIRNRNRAGVPPTDAVGPPACARSHQDVCEAVVQRIVGCDLALPEHLHVPVVAQLAETIVDDPAPGRQAGKACLADDPPTEFAGGLGEHHAVAPLAKCASSLQASRSGPWQRLRIAWRWPTKWRRHGEIILFTLRQWATSPLPVRSTTRSNTVTARANPGPP